MDQLRNILFGRTDFRRRFNPRRSIPEIEYMTVAQETPGSSAKPMRSGMAIPVWGILFLSAGIIALLNTTGAISWSVWLDMWRLWPMLLVLWGLNIIFHRFHPALIALIVVASVGGVVGFAYWADDGEVFAAEFTDFEYSVDRGDTQSLDLDIDFGAGTLNIGTLDASDTRLFHAALNDDVDGVDFVTVDNGDSESIRLRVDGKSGWLPWRSDSDREWTVLLHPDVTGEFNLDGGAGKFDIDLSNTQIVLFDMDIGAADFDLTVPANAGSVEGSISAGASDIRVVIPEEVAARIDNDSGVSSVDIDRDRFPKSGDLNESPDYDDAENRIDLTISAGASSITVE